MRGVGVGFASSRGAGLHGTGRVAAFLAGLGSSRGAGLHGTALGVAFLALLVTPRLASATTADGTLVTNVACATFATVSPGKFAVSYCSTAIVFIANPCINLQKTVTPSIQSAGGTLTFRLWVINCSPYASAFNVSVIDKVPDNVMFNTGFGVAGSWTAGPGVWSAYMSSDGAAWAGGEPPAGQVTPYYLRYILSLLGPSKSAYVQYGVNIL